MTKRLEGKTAAVTGGARGIGAAIAERLAADGAAVAISYSRSAKEAEALVARIRKAGGAASAHKADASVPEQAKAFVEAAFKAHGRLDILVNNAGWGEFVPLEGVSEKHVRAQFDLNVNGPIFTTQAAVPRFPEEGGRVINVSSIAGAGSMAGAGVYSATKAALDALTRVWASELGPRGVTVNGVAPGPVETDLMNAVADDAFKKQMISRTPLGRIGQPDDIADIVSFLTSSDARWVTGQTITSAGGMTP
ncbi:MAG: glucose 1-dehydrogenase [Elusimicrobia bacterium]|nr:glucose 1-dehydrogenase [Elusimicrobiota bacterium]